MNEKVAELIKQETVLKTGRLNLSGYELTEIPKQILEMNWLTELNLSNNKITEIRFFDQLINLLKLNLSFNKINKIKGLDKLINLSDLDLSENKISELTGLTSLINLSEINLSKNEINEIKGIENFINLSWLSLGHNQISEIKELDRLINLSFLNLSFNQINEIKKLDQLINLSFLDLSRNEISEIKNLSRLKNLKILSLDDNRIKEIKNLNKLHLLEELDLSGNPLINLIHLPQIVENPNLRVLMLFGIKSNHLNIPAEHFGNGSYSNCLKTLKGYFASLKKGSFQSKELPIILIGNSTAGKTSLRYFLQQNIFPPPKDHSTHGIEPSIWQPDEETVENLDEFIKPKDLQLFFWDFGGQEYYHATHRLFFIKKAIYILVWEKKTNKQTIENIEIKICKSSGEIESAILPVELFPYTYWLESIRHLATDAKESPIILLQNKMDEPGNDVKENPEPALLEINNCDALQLSIKKAYEINGEGRKDPLVDILLQKIFSAAKDLSSTVVYGALWEDIKKMLQDVRKENIWSPERFLGELKTFDPQVQENSMLSYLLSLRAMGYVIYEYDDPFLKNYIFINPGWVTEIIYSILDQLILENKGEFDKSHVIKKAGNEYADIFIALMKKFELIFEYEETYKNNKVIKYIAPQYLPKELENINKMIELDTQFNSFEKPGFILQFKDFMPRYIMLRFLVANGENAIGKYYWKNGIAFTLEKCSVLVLSDYNKKQFRIFTENSNHYVERLVFDKLVQLSENENSLLVAAGINDAIAYTALKEEFPYGKFSGNNTIKSISGQRVSLSVFKDLFEDITTVKRRHINNKVEKIKVFISYAHVNNDIRELFEERYLKAIQNHYAENIEVWSDKKLKPAAEWDNKIKNEINAADIIIFFLSNSFLASDYIKQTEIEYALQRYQQRRQIIVPVYIEEISKKLLPFSEKQYLPGGKPLKEWRPQNKGWVKIQEGLITIIDDIRNGTVNEYFLV